MYEARGQFQMRVVEMVVVGEGDLRRQLEKIRARLEARGLLAPERKRPLPRVPRRLGIVTSRDGAALRDILKVLRDRLPVPVLLCHAAVQGGSAPGEIVEGLRRLASVSDVDVVIVGRGGGSGDDLWAWNDEALAIAVAEHPVPVITAIGHETDVTIADLVSDRRAATPSEAAMLAVPDTKALEKVVANLDLRLARAQRFSLQRLRSRLDGATRRMPGKRELLEDRWQRLDELSRELEESLVPRIAAYRRRHHEMEVRLVAAHPRSELERARARLGRAAAALDALNPLRILARGYSMTRRPQGPVVTRAAELSVGDRLELTLHEGDVDCEVLATRPDARRGTSD
jgi:exodeoxyribonuclease VII large subunit